MNDFSGSGESRDGGEAMHPVRPNRLLPAADNSVARKGGRKRGRGKAESQVASAPLPSSIGGVSAGGDAANLRLEPNGEMPRAAKTKIARKGKLGGQECRDTPPTIASEQDIGRDHQRRVTQRPHVASEIDGGGHSGVDTQTIDAAPVDPTVIIQIRTLWRTRQSWHRAEKSLTLQAKANCRGLAKGGDKKEADVIYNAALGLKGAVHPESFTAYAGIFPLTDSRDAIKSKRLDIESELERLAKKLPVVAWVTGARGVALLSLAGIVGEAGDLTQRTDSYANPGKLWKRMGLAVFDGMRQRRVAGDAAIEQGYVASRRSFVWTIGENLIKAQVRIVKDADGKDTGERAALGPLGRLYLDRKVVELAKCEIIAADPDLRAKFGGDKYAPVAHAHNRAKRYMEKRFLRDLWAAWNGRGGHCCFDSQVGDAAAPDEQGDSD